VLIFVEESLTMKEKSELKEGKRSGGEGHFKKIKGRGVWFRREIHGVLGVS